MTSPTDLAAWRTARAWTVDQAARYLGCTESSYRNWEAGRRAPPDVLARLFSVLGIMECLAPALHDTMLPGPAVRRRRVGRPAK